MRSSLGGKIGRELNRLAAQVQGTRQINSYRTRTSFTTQGVHREPITPASSRSNTLRVAYIVSETRQWLKCQTPAQLDTENYTWVAKPPGLRCGTPLTSATYPEYDWAAAFTGERFIYRNPAERLRRYAPYFVQDTGIVTMHPARTLYEDWTDGTVFDDAEDWEALDPRPGGEALVVGNAAWFYEFQFVYPVYTHYTVPSFTADTPVPVEGAPDLIYITRLSADDEPDEVPADETFAAATVKWVDLNLTARTWMPEHIVKPWRNLVFKAGLNYRAVSSSRDQYVDQTFGNSNPALRNILPQIWGELNP